MNDAPPPLKPGTLYLVATPIGNLEDITLRALRVLRECDVVAAEDTRHSGRLLQHFGISKSMLSYFQFNEARRSEEILERLRRGEKIALVTDAGSPGISDPGARVVAAALAAGLRVEAVPGPCALVPALTASGLPTGEFHFVGFLPHKSGQRRRQLAPRRLRQSQCRADRRRHPSCWPRRMRPSSRRALSLRWTLTIPVRQALSALRFRALLCARRLPMWTIFAELPSTLHWYLKLLRQA